MVEPTAGEAPESIASTEPPTTEPLAAELLAVELLAALPGEAADQVRALVDALQTDPKLTPTAIRVAFARAGRVAGGFGHPIVEGSLGGVPKPMEGWQAHLLARMTVLLGAIGRLAPAEQVALVETLYRTGGEQEQQAVLRALSYLPQPERFVELAAEATRTNVTTVLAALACENTFPTQHMRELNFNQMVLKSIFLGIDTVRVVGIERRVTPELVRMLQDYAAERRAAGRSVPEDIDRIGRLLPKS